MAWAMELRVPFVDRALFDRVAPNPVAHRLATGKKLLQAAVPELPEWVTRRRKQGFVVPFSQWALFALDQFLHKHGLETR